jgi:hypothetical protein
MTEINHRSGAKSSRRYHHPRQWIISNVTALGDRSITATGDPLVGKEVSGAKQYVRSRTRFHENAATRKLAAFHDSGE